MRSQRKLRKLLLQQLPSQLEFQTDQTNTKKSRAKTELCEDQQDFLGLKKSLQLLRMFLATKLVLQSRRHLNLRANMSMKVQNPYKISLILLQIFQFVDPSDTELHHQKKLLFVKHVTVTELRPETVRKLLPYRAKVMKTRMRIPLFCNSLRINYCKQKWNTLLKLPPTKSGI